MRIEALGSVGAVAGQEGGLLAEVDGSVAFGRAAAREDRP